MKLAILTCMWQRPEIFKIFATGLRRLQDKFNVIPFIVGSEGHFSRRQCEGFYYLEYPNDPLGAKYNAGMRAVKDLKPDYVMGLGSDDLISDDTMEYVLEKCHEGYDLIGFSDMYLYDIHSLRLGYWKGYSAKHRIGESTGMGRTISRRVLNIMNWSPRDPKVNKGLDWTMTVKLKRINYSKHVVSLREKGLFAVDIKSGHNICSFDLYSPKLVDLELLKQIPEL